MAAVSLGAPNAHTQNARDTLDRRPLVLDVTVANTGDTHALSKPARRVAWEPDNTSDPIAVTLDGAGTTVTFTGTNGSTGYLWIYD